MIIEPWHIAFITWTITGWWTMKHVAPQEPPELLQMLFWLFVGGPFVWFLSIWFAIKIIKDGSWNDRE